MTPGSVRQGHSEILPVDEVAAATRRRLDMNRERPYNPRVATPLNYAHSGGTK